MTTNWENDLKQQIEAKTGTKDFANTAEDGALLQRIEELEKAWKPLLDYLSHIGQTYQAGDKVLQAYFLTSKKSKTIRFDIGFEKPDRKLDSISADFNFLVSKEFRNSLSPESKSLMPKITDDNELQIASGNGGSLLGKNGTSRYTPKDINVLIKGLNRYVADQVANGGLQKRYIRKDIDLSPKP